MRRARDVVARLRLERHPEGGWYRETWRSPRLIDGRSAATAILYLLESGDRSRFHRLRTAEEAWFHHAGDPLTLHVLDAAGRRAVSLSADDPQAVIPPDTWFGATVDPPGSWALCACVVVPGFEFPDFELARRDELLRAWPDAADVVTRLTDGGDDA